MAGNRQETPEMQRLGLAGSAGVRSELRAMKRQAYLPG
jgi:hypothetical protein